MPLGAALLILATIIIGSFYNYSQTRMNRETAMQINSVAGLFKEELKNDTHLMSGLIDFLKVDPCLQRYFQARDRAALLLCAAPIFEQMYSQHRVTHFYFHTPARINFLRVHNVVRHGDVIDRITMQGAFNSGSPFSGIELGLLGTLTLRTVHPWYLNGELIGYIELGEEIGHITNNRLLDVLAAY
ncbi:MAG: hypothetical protein V3T17_07465 [Pseudomonadales bacterium]